MNLIVLRRETYQFLINYLRYYNKIKFKKMHLKLNLKIEPFFYFSLLRSCNIIILITIS